MLVNGARQSGKTTLLRQVHRRTGGTIVSLDNPADLRQARLDPTSFVNDTPKPLFIDEIQRGGDPLVLAIKAAVDIDSKPGRFYLAGSTRFLHEPRLSESLAGRVRIVDLWPLSQGELHGGHDRLIDAVFDDPASLLELSPADLPARSDYARRVTAGGFPGLAVLEDERLRSELLDDYVRTIVQRDVRELSRIRQVPELDRMVRLLAARTAQELNVSGLANELAIERHTVSTYLALLDTLYLHHEIRPFSRNLSARVVRRPKLHLVDSGLAANLNGFTAARLANPTESAFGALLETFVAGEVAKQLTWSSTQADSTHFREHSGAEVDLVIEARDGRVLAIEVKGSVAVDADDLRHLRSFRRLVGEDRFVAGIVLYCGDRVRRLGDGFVAVPIAALWQL